MGEPPHEHGMVEPRRNLGLIYLVAATTGPIRSGPERSLGSGTRSQRFSRVLTRENP